MKYIQGNLLDLAEAGQFDVIIQGCNCFHMMGAGIAGQIAQRYPQAVYADKATSRGDERKLGNFSMATHWIKPTRHSFAIVNAYTQFEGGRNLDVSALDSVFGKIADTFKGLRIGYPAIGCGIAGGSWLTIAPVIETQLKGIDHTFVDFDGSFYVQTLDVINPLLDADGFVVEEQLPF